MQGADLPEPTMCARARNIGAWSRLGRKAAVSIADKAAARSDSLGKLNSVSRSLSSANGCPPVHGLKDRADWKNGRDCIVGMRGVYEQVVARPSIELFVLGIFAGDLKDWGILRVVQRASQAQRFAVFERLLEADIQYLRAAGKCVVVSYDMPFAPVQARDCLPRPLRAWLADSRSGCYPPEASLRERQPFVRLLDEFLATRNDVCVFRQSELMLHDGRLHFVDEHGRLLRRVLVPSLVVISRARHHGGVRAIHGNDSVP